MSPPPLLVAIKSLEPIPSRRDLIGRVACSPGGAIRNECLGRAVGNPAPHLCLPVFSSSDKFWYCRLSPNHKVLHYGDLEESPQGEVPHDSLQDKRKCPPAGGRRWGSCLFAGH